MQVQLIAVSNLRVAIPISGIRELQRYEYAMRGAKPPWPLSKLLTYKGLTDQRRQKLVKNDRFPSQTTAEYWQSKIEELELDWEVETSHDQCKR